MRRLRRIFLARRRLCKGSAVRVLLIISPVILVTTSQGFL